MLSISSQQMKVFAPQMRQLFEDNSVRMLRDHYPQLTAQRSDEKLLEFVKFGCARAEKSAIVSEAGFERWLHLMMRLGPRFDEEPGYARVAQVLTNTALAEGARLDAAEQLLKEMGAP